MQPNEHKASIDAARGARAEGLLRDELLTEAFKTLEDAYTAAWRSSPIDNVSGREKLFLAINIVGKVKEHLEKAVSDGSLAQSDLRQIAEAAERKKSWHEVR